jgi:hypothetical protein
MKKRVSLAPLVPASRLKLSAMPLGCIFDFH